jgi:hypothetical protein
MAQNFNWHDFFMSGQGDLDEHWVEGELVEEELDLQPVLAPSYAPSGPAGAGSPATGVAATPPATTPPAGTTAPAA